MAVACDIHDGRVDEERTGIFVATVEKLREASGEFLASVRW